MDENHQDKAGSKLVATEDLRWIFNKKHKLWLPQHKKHRWKAFKDNFPFNWLNLLGVLAIPFVVTFVGLNLTQQIALQQTQASERQHLTDLQIANDQQQEATLQTYLDRMSELLLTNKLGESKPGDAVRNVARARTLTALRRLDPVRKGLLVQFLADSFLIENRQPSDSSLIEKKQPIVDMQDADLTHADLEYANLYNTYLLNTNLSGADLSGAILDHAYLTAADFSKVTQSNCADFSYASLVGANFSGANLSYAILDHTDLRAANLYGADLSYADLSGATVTKEQLAEAKSLEGTILPTEPTSNVHACGPVQLVG